MKKAIIAVILAVLFWGCSKPIEPTQTEEISIPETLRNCYENPVELSKVDVKKLQIKFQAEGFEFLEGNSKGMYTYSKQIEVKEFINAREDYESFIIYFAFDALNTESKSSSEHNAIYNCSIYLSKSYSKFEDDNVYAIDESYSVETIYDAETRKYIPLVKIGYHGDDLYYWSGTELIANYEIRLDAQNNQNVTETSVRNMEFNKPDLKSIMNLYEYEIDQFFEFNFPVTYEEELSESDTEKVKETLSNCLGAKGEKYELSFLEIKLYFEELGFEVDKGMDSRVYVNNLGETSYHFSALEKDDKITDCEFYVSERTKSDGYEMYRTGYLISNNEFRYLENISKATSKVATAKYGFVYNITDKTVNAEELELTYYSNTELDNEVLNTRPNDSRAIEYYEIYLEGYNQFFD